MPKQTSLVTFTGKMGGISFYKKDGKHVARMASGPSKANILNDKRFARTRENMSEFGALAVATASLNRMLAPVKNLKDTGLRNRVSKVFRAMIRKNPGARGQRPVLVTQNRADLIGLELNDGNQFRTHLTAKYTVSHSADRKTATITIPELKMPDMVSAPTGTTHVQIVLLVGVLADVAFNVAANRYELTDAALSGVTSISSSDYIALDNPDPLQINLQAVLPVNLNDKVSVLQAVGLLFFNKNGTAYYPSQQGKGMQIVDVF
jgi:hypothetical protein